MTCDLQSLNWELSDLKPPIPRDRLIFEEVLVKGRGQLEVAQEQGISQPRVSKILAEVGAWLCRVLPASAAQEPPEGQLALGVWLAQARLEFLYHKALAAFDASGQDKVTIKQGKRENVNWEEKITRPQNPVVGLFNGALRAVTAASRMCTAAAKSSGKVRPEQQGMSPPNLVMSKSAIMEDKPQLQSPQTQGVPPLATDEYDGAVPSEAVIKKVMEIARQNPKRADWSEVELRHAAETTWAKLDVAIQEQEARRREKAAAKKAKAEAKAARAAAAAVPLTPEPAVSSVEAQALPIPEQHAAELLSLRVARIEKLRREREKRRSPQERRREFLAPLAAG